MGKLSVKIILLMLVTLLGWCGVVNAGIISVSKSGTGSGIVRSNSVPAVPPATGTVSINCGSICGDNFQDTDSVVLSPMPDPGSEFIRWVGGSCDGLTGSCTVTGAGSFNETALFNVSRTNLTVLNEGSGSDYGQITSSPVGIVCEGDKYNGTSNTDCTEPYNQGVGVDLFAKVNTFDGAFFSGWKVEFLVSGGYVQQTQMCTGLDPTCHVTIPFNVSDIRVRAKFDLGYILTIQRDGTGAGTITANSENLQNICSDAICTQTYSKFFSNGTTQRTVTLSAVGTNSSVFKKWTDSICTVAPNSASNPMCTVTMDKANTVTAVFDPTNPSRYDLTLIKEGSGSDYGFVATVPQGTDPVNCGGVKAIADPNVKQSDYPDVDLSHSTNTDCTGNFAAGQGITLVAVGYNGAVFSRWQVSFLNNETPPKYILNPNICTGLEPRCSVTMASYAEVRAQFDLGYILTVVRAGSGNGSIVSDSPDLDKCTTTGSNICNQTFNKDRIVTLTAIAQNNSKFVNWGTCFSNNKSTTDPLYEGTDTLVAGSATKEICKVKMNDAKLVTATFELGQSNANVLSVTVNGSGQVVSNPTGIACGSACLNSFQENVTVALQALPDKNNQFIGWGGDCSSFGSSPICTVKMIDFKLRPGSVTASFQSILSMTVTKSGTGLGTVSSDQSEIDCGSVCSFDFATGKGVLLTATPQANSRFKGWSGACASRGAQPQCAVTITGSAQVADAEFEVISGPLLSVTKSGTGAGTVTTSPTGINCGPVCSVNFATNALVRLTAVPDSNSAFTGWGGACSNRATLPTCDVTMDQANDVTASFSVKTNELTVTKSGVGSGEIVSNPAGINCGATCKASFSSLIQVGLTANPAAGSIFSGWGGACSGQSTTCYVSMDQVQSVTASFAIANQLSVVGLGTGFGTVVSDPVGISCDGSNTSTCKATFLKDTAVTLTANIIGGSQFIGWSGACSGAKPTCFLTMKNDQSVTATFNWVGSIINSGLLIGKLNDTGIDWCANNSVAYPANKDAWCTSLIATHPGQDGQEGRDLYARQGLLTKLGKGEAGFDYTKICNNGQAAGEGTCPLAPVLGNTDTDWGCTRDNVTNFIWEVKTVGGTRDKDAVYSWFEPNDRLNGGSKGSTCTGILCNTDAYVQAINKQGLCAANDWRMPTRQELHSIVNQGRGKPSVDITYFPNTVSNGYWTATPVAAQIFQAWYVNFEYGWDYWDNKNNQQHVRLVRVCQTCEDNTPVSSPVFRDGRLSIPAVNVDGQYYAANLTMINDNPLTFGLVNVQLIDKKRVGRSGSSDQVRYYSADQRVVIGGVIAGDHRYNATLQYVPGTSPAQFALSAAKLAN